MEGHPAYNDLDRRELLAYTALALPAPKTFLLPGRRVSLEAAWKPIT